MPKRKVTFVYDPEVRKFLLGDPPMEHEMEQYIEKYRGVDPFSITVEELPDPPIRQRLVMEIESDPEMGPFDPTGWANILMERGTYVPMSFNTARRRILSFKEEPNA